MNERDVFEDGGQVTRDEERRSEVRAVESVETIGHSRSTLCFQSLGNSQGFSRRKWSRSSVTGGYNNLYCRSKHNDPGEKLNKREVV